MRVYRSSIGVGRGGPGEDVIALGSDVRIMCFDGASQWGRRFRYAEYVTGLVTLEYGTSAGEVLQKKLSSLKFLLDFQYFHYYNDFYGLLA
jgi:hypothetical protein